MQAQQQGSVDCCHWGLASCLPEVPVVPPVVWFGVVVFSTFSLDAQLIGVQALENL